VFDNKTSTWASSPSTSSRAASFATICTLLPNVSTSIELQAACLPFALALPLPLALLSMLCASFAAFCCLALLAAV
jgi:hypothetical protein